LCAGAMGYVMKRVAPRSIVGAIREVRLGRIYLSSGTQVAMQTRQTPGDKCGLAATVEEFSDRELEIFLLIGQGLKKRDITERIGRSGNTVDTHRARIRKKLKVRSGVEVARLAFQYCQDGSRQQASNIPV